MAKKAKRKKSAKKKRASGKKPVSRAHWLPSEGLLSSAARIVGEERARALAGHAKGERAFLRAVVAEAPARSGVDLPARPGPQGRYDAAADQLPFALFVVDSGERFVYANRAAEILTGRSRRDLVGRSIAEALAEDEAGEETLAERLSVIVRRARSGRDPVEYEIAYALPTGARFDVGFTAALVGRAPLDREESDVVVAGRDLHAPGEGIKLRAGSKLSAEAEADLRRRLRQVERQMARSERLMAIGQMAAGFVHEINNPLGALQGLVQILQMDIDEKDPTSEVLADVSGEIGRIERIAEGMLELAKSSGGLGTPGFAPVDVVEVVGPVVRIMTPQLKVRRVKVARADPDAGAWVLGDADRLRQMLMNLILNASQAMSPGDVHPVRGGTITILVKEDEVSAADLPERPSRAADLAEADHEAIRREVGKRAATDAAPPWREGMKLVRIEVEDSGPGIPEHVLGRIFEPFFTTRSAVGGTGLGLSTSEAIVRAHGGTITAENVEAGGAHFTVRFPACEKPRG